ncbi:intestinal mucin-like protein [Xenopus laevis]|uniref:Intestinal mucin-like protein n=1 Tax=Xenopus laevis TaxID=8355 RepID=A0A8J0UYR4_XENLA|nr:intestinal mucin-like protein [Xenopus laevis]
MPMNDIITTNEKWNLDNCTVATCHGNNIVTLEQVTCPVAEKVTCATGSKPIVVYSLNGCCYHYECQGVCVVMDNNQYMTFDGTTYEFVNNCTNILVQEINEQYNHFLILAKNDYCSEANSASCPQMIIISFENNIVTLMRSMKNGAMNKQIMFNQKIVSPGFTKDGITISSTVIDIVVNIAALKAHIIFSDTLFMLTLPLSTFLNSTEGLCGTFTNNRSDDCLFPDGTYASECSQIAPFWNFNNITDPICSQALPLNTTEQTPTITTCIETNLCDIINSSVFAPCHENIPPDTYFQMCLKKACQTDDEINLCSILESYARQCQLQGTCVDWRNSTGNMCACIGPDGMPKMPGSSWITGCYDCICEMNSVTVQCQPVQCATPVTPPCTNAGYAVVEVKDPLQPCCSKFECRCNTSLCQNTTTTECPLGFQLTVPVYANGECCVINECKPMNVCVENGTIYLPGESWNMPGNNCSYHVCEAREDHVILTTVQTLCAVLSQSDCGMPGEVWSPSDNPCVIHECVQKVDTVYLDSKQKLCIINCGPPGETFIPPDNPCIKYICSQADGLVAEKTVCPKFDAADCKEGTSNMTADGCCMTCEMQDLVLESATTFNYDSH